MSRSLARITAGLMLAALAGCGGGGGGDDGGGGGGDSPLSYSGNTNPAVVTTGNAASLTGNVMGSGNASGGVSGLSAGTAVPEANGLVDLGRRLNRSVRGTLLQPGRASSGQRSTAAIPVDATEPCDSGSVRTAGTLNDNGTGTLSVSYNDCRSGDDTLSGPATMRVDAFDLVNLFATDYTISFSRLTLRGSGGSTDLAGSLRSQVRIPTNTETITENVIALNNNTGHMTKSENLVFVDVYNNIFFPSSYVESISGRIFDKVHGFVDITTSVPFVFGTLTQVFPNSGQMLLTGAANARIRSTAFSPTLVTLALDLNGDNVFERVATLNWTDLSGPAGADLADDDNDGMHNSWELAKGLNPLDPGDALSDSDGDGSSNIAEYHAGTSPNNAGSIPPAVGLSIAASDSPDPATVGGILTYAITVSNSSALAANNVIVADTLPHGVNLVSATAGQGSCAGAGPPLNCNLGTINGFGSVVVTIVVMPTAEGIISNTATMTTSSFDPNTADNSATSTTTVGQPAAGIQGQIDAAADGATVLVGPGTHVGGLNFNGKNIVLRSSHGPASTIIHGNQGTAVRMGPGGALIGFTITGSSASFGGGIEVSGQGSLISGNIFDGNVQGAGGFGAAIGGNAASPTIERNIFRNNSCDNQFLSGVVAFVNGSSPQIVNNIFENNPCRAINLSLPEFNAPQIINNTFVGNRAGIRVDRRVPQVTQVYRNNIIVQNGIGLEIEFGATDADNPVWANNLVFGNTVNYQGTASQTGTSGNISANPLFINQGAGNYRLQPGSPAIDAGGAVSVPAVDFDGAPRPLDGNGDATPVVDIGAFEAAAIP